MKTHYCNHIYFLLNFMTAISVINYIHCTLYLHKPQAYLKDKKQNSLKYFDFHSPLESIRFLAAMSSSRSDVVTLSVRLLPYFSFLQTEPMVLENRM